VSFASLSYHESRNAAGYRINVMVLPTLLEKQSYQIIYPRTAYQGYPTEEPKRYARDMTIMITSAKHPCNGNGEWERRFVASLLISRDPCNHGKHTDRRVGRQKSYITFLFIQCSWKVRLQRYVPSDDSHRAVVTGSQFASIIDINIDIDIQVHTLIIPSTMFNTTFSLP
jgi:hypothetical protein